MNQAGKGEARPGTFAQESCNCLMSKENETSAGIEALSAAGPETDDRKWYVLRDLTRSNAKMPGYRLLSEQSFEVFTPMRRKTVVREGRKTWVEVPYLQDLLFVHESRAKLDPLIEKTETLQYRYVRGAYCEPMTVPSCEMSRFIHAVRSSTSAKYYRPEELTPSMYGKYVRIVGGALDGYEGYLLSLRGSKVRRLLVELPNYLTTAVEVRPDLIEVLG